MHFDGINSLHELFRRYGWDPWRGEENELVTFRTAHVLCRITILVQSILITITNTAKQSVRAVTMLLSGLFTGRVARLIHGSIDLGSVLIQIIALPIIGIIATFSPSWGSWLCRQVGFGLGPPNSESESQSPELLPDKFVYCMKEFGWHWTDPIAKAITCLTTPIQAILTHIQGFFSALLLGEVRATTLLFPVTLIVAPLYSLFHYSPGEEVVFENEKPSLKETWSYLCSQWNAKNLHSF